MKRLIALFLVLLLLGGCAKSPTPPPPPQPVYGTAPVASGAGMTIQGIGLSGLYEANGLSYVKMSEFAAAVGKEFTVAEGIEVHIASLAMESGPIHFTTDTQPPEGISATYLCGSIYDGTDWYHPVDQVLPYFNYHSFRDEKQNHTYYTAYPTADSVAEGHRVPTLMYHAVSDDCWGIQELFVSPSKMEEQLKYLAENGYTTITFEDMGRLDEIEKPVLLTFDDGYEDNYTELFPLLKKYNAKATVFMIMGFVGRAKYLTADQIKEMDASGLVSFQSHTMTHAYLSTRNAEQLQYELLDSKLELARLIGKESFVIAYPSGRYSEASLKETGEHYQFGLLSRGGMYTTGTDRVKIPRKYVARSTGISSYAAMLK